MVPAVNSKAPSFNILWFLSDILSAELISLPWSPTIISLPVIRLSLRKTPFTDTSPTPVITPEFIIGLVVLPPLRVS